MQLRADVLYTAHDSNPAGQHALGILERRFDKRIEVLTGADFKLQPGCVAFVMSKDITYPSRYLRVLPADVPHGGKAYSQRQVLLERMPWLVCAQVVVSINPGRVNGPGGTFIDTRTEFHLTGFTDALEYLCGHRRPYTDPLAHLSPHQKHALRLSERRKERRREHFS